MAQMIRDREISPVELIESHLRQIQDANPKLNAFVVVMPEEALAAAKQAEAAVSRGDSLGLLHGVPLSVKDSFDVAGLPTLCGSRLRLGHRADADATSVARLRAAGAILIGKTNCPEFLSNYESDNYVTGRTNNPWDLERTAGGSSGGEAAAIASYCSAGGIGSDGGGSIRIPAHFCGIAGLKPTPGRVSAAGHFPQICHPGGLLGVAGPMARSAQDVRLLFAALAGYDDQDPFAAPVPLRVPVVADITIGIMEQFYSVPVQPVMKEMAGKAAQAFERIGFAVEPFQPRGLERAPNLWSFFFGRLPASGTKKVIAGRETDVHWTALEFLELALAQPAPTVEETIENLAERDRMRAGFLRQMDRVPLLLMPACAVPAFRHRERHWQAGDSEISLFQAMMTVTPWNLLGLPAVVVPFGFTDSGLPVGVQIVGRPFCEELILEVAVRLEEARGPLPGPAGFGE
jgi:Asp-tRNA(Asn)/Glu-tRNA(Gln) amidotransferase A subunit family amidase